jgi:hypothetical protein
MSPEECLFSEDPNDLRLRFPHADEHQLNTLGQDLYDENKRLKKHIAKADLQNWFQGMLAQAKEEVQGAEGDETITMEDAEGDVTME